MDPDGLHWRCVISPMTRTLTGIEIQPELASTARFLDRPRNLRESGDRRAETSEIGDGRVVIRAGRPGEHGKDTGKRHPTIE